MHLRKFKKLLWGVFFLSALLFSGIAAAQRGEIFIPGEQQSAFLVAYSDFGTKGWDLKNFDVYIRHLRAGYEVAFVPHQVPRQATRRGGGISYVVSFDGKIVKKVYDK